MKTPAYLTADLPGIGGAIKQRPDDFHVTEIPLYEPSGEGTHTYFGLSKRGLATREAIGRVAAAIGAKPHHFASAGLKDAHAVTEQAVSVEHLRPDQRQALAELHTDAVWVTWVSSHTNKLKTGHLAGNRFVIRIRDIQIADLPKAEAILDVLKQRGVPNYFGAQRFGARGDNWKLGAAVIGGRLDEFARLFLGTPLPSDPPACFKARELFDAGDYEQALATWPGRNRDQKNALRAWIRTGGNVKSTFAAVDKFLKRFCVSAFQSYLFNRIVGERIDEIDTVRAGDWAKKVDSGGVFLVEDESVDCPRAQAFEISPTGPLYGYRVRMAEGEPGTLEQSILDEFGLTGENWRRSGAFKVKGTRRALRYPIEQVSLSAGDDDAGPFIETAFIAPPGCYATVLLRELMKNDQPDITPETA